MERTLPGEFVYGFFNRLAVDDEKENAIGEGEAQSPWRKPRFHFHAHLRCDPAELVLQSNSKGERQKKDGNKDENKMPEKQLGQGIG